MCVCVNIFPVKILGTDLFHVSGKTALVTGGSSGIGQFMAKCLHDAGAEVIVVGRREERLKQTLQTLEKKAHSAQYICLDLADDNAISALSDELSQRGTHPDIIVNAAGVNPRKHADEITQSEWISSVHLNLNIPFFVAQACVQNMKQKGWGRIINIASLQSSRAFENGIAYGAAKGGISQLTRAMAEAWSKYGICANAIAPGFFPTELTAPVFANQDVAARHAQNTAIGRNGVLDDLKGPLLFLASDASRYVTGQVLGVDGGYTAK